MSGCSSETDCPNCGKDADLYVDWKPFESSTITCAHCGFMAYPVVKYMTLKDLNEYRRNLGLKLLRKKPEQDKNAW